MLAASKIAEKNAEKFRRRPKLLKKNAEKMLKKNAAKITENFRSFAAKIA